MEAVSLRVAFLTLSLVLVTFAGCVDVPTPTDVPADPAAASQAPDVLTWKGTSCDAAIGVIPVPSENLAPHLPEGFRPLTPSELGLPPDPRGDAVFALEAFRCAEYDANGRALTDAPIGGFFTFVEPPEALREEADYYFFRWDGLVPDATLHETLVAAGFPMREGDATVQAEAPTGTGKGPIRAQLTLGEEAFGFRGVAGGEWEDETEGRFVEWTWTTGNDLGVWRANFTWHEISTGAGEMRLASGSLPAEVAGAEEVPAYFLWGLLSLDGAITLPPI